MITQSQESNPMIKDFSQYKSALLKNASPWLSRFREDNDARFQKLGFPTTRNEEWKYTNVSPVISREYHLPKGHSLVHKDLLKEHLNDKDINLVFINGVLSKELSSSAKLPKGLKLTPLLEAVSVKAVQDILLETTPNDPEPFLALNNAYHKDGIVIEAENDAVVEPLIHIVYVVDGDVENTIHFPRTLIIAGKSAQINIMETHVGLAEGAYFVNAVTDGVLAENSFVRYCQSQQGSLRSYHIGSTRFWQKRDSQLQAFNLSCGGTVTRNNLTVLSQGEGTSSTINGFYTMDGDRHVDNHTLVDHQQPNCTSFQLYKGILNGSSRAVFNGKIFVKPIAQKTNSYQLNKNLLLGADCRIDTKPQLEIGADDVKCTHGATIGQLNEEEVFYFMARAIPKAQAVMMLARGFVDDILNTVQSEAIREKLDRILSKTFAALR